jgi:hypothetical protein
MTGPSTTPPQPASRILARIRPQCVECRRVFDLNDPEQAQEWYYGHDCEVS